MEKSDNSINDNTVLEMKQITKVFPGVIALEGVDFNINKNEIVGLVGENGAGKTVLMSIMIGLLQADEGTLTLGGMRITPKSPADAQKYGIGMVFQEGSLIPNMSIEENLFLCHEVGFRKCGLLSLKNMRDVARDILSQVKLNIDMNIPVSKISPEARKMVEIARILWLSKLYGQDNPILILDEPTTVFADSECDTLFSILHEIKKQASVVLISHRLKEVVENSDRIVVLRDGQNVTEMVASGVDLSIIEQLMVGHSLSMDRFHEDQMRESKGREIFKVENLSKSGSFQPLSFSVSEGEIVSLVGLVGSGKEDVCRCITGLERADTGDVYLNGNKLIPGSPGSTVQQGLGHIPIDRRQEGLALGMSVAKNINMLILNQLKTAGFINPKRERENVQKWVDEFQIKTPSLVTMCSNLSGGNQQKTVIAKWLSSNIRMLILDHPTRGVDVGAKEEIYKIIRALAKDGIGMIIMCDTLEEDIGLADRILVMKDGTFLKMVDSVPKKKPSLQEILNLIV